MRRSNLQPMNPYFTERWEAGPEYRSVLITEQAAFASLRLKPDEMLRCWFCYRSSWASWGVLMRCHGSGACQTTYFVRRADDPKAGLDQPLVREGCPPCAERRLFDKMFGYRTNRRRCFRCKIVQPVNPIMEMVPFLEPALREEHEQRGNIVEGKPSWKSAKIVNPWQPRVDVKNKEALLNKLKFYRRYEDQKSAKGRDINLDYRKMKEVQW